MLAPEITLTKKSISLYETKANLTEVHHALTEDTSQTSAKNPEVSDPGDGVVLSQAVKATAEGCIFVICAREIGLLCGGPIGGLLGWAVVMGVACYEIDPHKGPIWFYEPTKNIPVGLGENRVTEIVNTLEAIVFA